MINVTPKEDHNIVLVHCSTRRVARMTASAISNTLRF